jgi:serine/threonine protein kinase
MSSGSLARRRRIEDHMVLVKDEVVRGHHAYTIDQLVGSGAYAAVYRARDEMGRRVALKEFFPALHPRDAYQLRMLWERERYVLTQVSPHPLMLRSMLKDLLWRRSFRDTRTSTQSGC